jgi:hypothetical protein
VHPTESTAVSPDFRTMGSLLLSKNVREPAVTGFRGQPWRRARCGAEHNRDAPETLL